MKLLAVVFSFLFASAALAQTPIPAEAQLQACQSRLLEVIQGELNVRAQAIVWQRDMLAAQKRVKELEDKYEKTEEKK